MLTLAKLFLVSCIHVITQIWIFLIVESFVYPGQLPRQGKKRHISCQMKVAPDPVITELPVTCPRGTQPRFSRIATGQTIPGTTSSCHLNSWFLGTFPLFQESHDPGNVQKPLTWAHRSKIIQALSWKEARDGPYQQEGSQWASLVRNMFASILFSNIGSC